MCFVQTSRYARSFSRCFWAPVVTAGDNTLLCRQPQTPDWRQDLASILLKSICRSRCFQHCSTLLRIAAAQALCCYVAISCGGTCLNNKLCTTDNRLWARFPLVHRPSTHRTPRTKHKRRAELEPGIYNGYPVAERAGDDPPKAVEATAAAEEEEEVQPTYQDLEGDQGLPGYTGTNGPSLTSLALLEDDDSDKGDSGKLLSGGLFSWTTHTRSTSSVSSRSIGSFSTPREARSM